MLKRTFLTLDTILDKLEALSEAIPGGHIQQHDFLPREELVATLIAFRLHGQYFASVPEIGTYLFSSMRLGHEIWDQLDSVPLEGLLGKIAALGNLLRICRMVLMTEAVYRHMFVRLLGVLERR